MDKQNEIWIVLCVVRENESLKLPSREKYFDLAFFFFLSVDIFRLLDLN